MHHWSRLNWTPWIRTCQRHSPEDLQIILQPTVDSAISQIGQSVPNFVVQELRAELGPVLTLLLLMVEQIVLGLQPRLNFVIWEIAQVMIWWWVFSVLLQEKIEPVKLFDK